MFEKREYPPGPLTVDNFPRESREAEIGQILEAIGSGKKVILLTGPRSTGKTSLGKFITSERFPEISGPKLWINLQLTQGYQPLLLEIAESICDIEYESAKSWTLEQLEEAILSYLQDHQDSILIGIDETEDMLPRRNNYHHLVIEFLQKVKATNSDVVLIFSLHRPNLKEIQEELISKIYLENEVAVVELAPSSSKRNS